MSVLSLRRIAGAVFALALTAGCRDRSVTAPELRAPTDAASDAVARCDVDIAARRMTCSAITTGRAAATRATPALTTSPGPHADRVVGGQDMYVKLESANAAFNSGTGIFSADVTVQNLARFSMGTTDGVATLGVKVFFEQAPTVTSGSGTVTIGNADGTDAFTTTNQPYFGYGQILHPYEISNRKQWQFNVSPSVVRFSFVVYVDAPMTDETGTLLDRVWSGATDAAWLTATNWQNGAAPDSTSTVGIPTDSLLAVGHHEPALAGDATIANLRVGSGNTLDLGGHTLRVKGNVDAVGPISNGVVNVDAASAVIGGSFAGLQVSGAARTQRATTTTAAVSVSGALTVADQALVIRIP